VKHAVDCGQQLVAMHALHCGFPKLTCMPPVPTMAHVPASELESPVASLEESGAALSLAASLAAGASFELSGTPPPSAAGLLVLEQAAGSSTAHNATQSRSGLSACHDGACVRPFIPSPAARAAPRRCDAREARARVLRSDPSERSAITRAVYSPQGALQFVTVHWARFAASDLPWACAESHAEAHALSPFAHPWRHCV
jgi:hypothetical protein